MVRTVRGLLLLTGLICLAPCSAQELPPPRTLPPTLPVLTGPPPPGAAVFLESPPVELDPLLDPPQLPPPGLFAAVEASLVGPHIKGRLSAPVTVAGDYQAPC